MKQIPEGYYPIKFGLFNTEIEQPCDVCGNWEKGLYQFRHESGDDYRVPPIYVCHKDRMKWLVSQEVKAGGFE